MNDQQLVATSDVLLDVAKERRRQDASAWVAGWTRLRDSERLSLLAKEVGDVAETVCRGLGPATAANAADLREGLAAQRAALRQHLIQVAAVAVAWVEALDRADLLRGLAS